MPSPSSAKFDWSVVALSTWFVVGAYLDGWAHNHIPDLESFFTPWHAVLYSGFFALAGFLAVSAWMGRRRGASWKEAVPLGYYWSLIGATIFLIGGMGDMVWHIVFGVESSVDALLSPTHLILVCGGMLMVLGPARAYWSSAQKRQAASALSHWPAVLSLTFGFSILTFIGQFANPADVLAAGTAPATVAVGHDIRSWGVASIMLTAALLMGFILTFYHRAKFPFGGFMLMFGLNAIGMGIMKNSTYLVPGALAAGLAADLLAQRLHPEKHEPKTLRAFAALVPAIITAMYFLTLLMKGPVWWSIHMWAGSIVMSGAVGLLLSYVFLPPASA